MGKGRAAAVKGFLGGRFSFPYRVKKINSVRDQGWEKRTTIGTEREREREREATNTITRKRKHYQRQQHRPLHF